MSWPVFCVPGEDWFGVVAAFSNYADDGGGGNKKKGKHKKKKNQQKKTKKTKQKKQHQGAKKGLDDC